MKQNGIDLIFDFDRPIMTDGTLVDLQRVLRQILPKWSSGLHIWRYREPKREVPISDPHRLRDLVIEVGETRGPLFRQLETEHGRETQRRFGSVEVRGSSASAVLVIQFDTLITPRAGDVYRWGNSVALQLRAKKVEADPVDRWSAEAFEELTAALSPAYAHGETVEEFRSKNIVEDSRGVEAIGVDISKSLPGIYWVNFFGRALCEFIGREKLLTSPAYVAKALDDGVLVQLTESATDWETAERAQVEARVLRHVGAEYFFAKDDPRRKTIAPPVVETSTSVQ